MFIKILCIVLIAFAIGQAIPIEPEVRAERSASPEDFLSGLLKTFGQPSGDANKGASGDNNAANKEGNNASGPDYGKMALDAAQGIGKVATDALKLFSG